MDHIQDKLLPEPAPGFVRKQPFPVPGLLVPTGDTHMAWKKTTNNILQKT